ncbi:MAG: SDR family oxidoreductase [Candidatus Lokiarchaeota archaeon]|nr:SDR family oxidoreductase [Candidatus Lokiarchaeota archaeon]
MVEKILEGKGALITGGASGFGRGVAYAFAERGADLVLVDINEDLLEETSKKIREKTKRKVVPIVCDVSKSDQVEAMAKQAFQELDNVFVLFNNAGVGYPYGADLLRTKEKDWDRILNINLKGQWLVSKFVSKRMKKQTFEPLAGKIIHTASIAGMKVDNKTPVYTISKVGIIAMVQMLAQSLAPKITVNSISPGYHITGIYDNREDAVKIIMDDGHVKTPLNRLGTVEDVVNVLLFLASNLSDFITGHNFPIDGGITEVGVPAYYFKSEI